MRFVAFSFPCSSLLRSLSSFFSLNFLFTISFAFALAILHGGDTNAKCHCHTLFIHFPEPRTNTQLFYIYFFPLFCMAANDRLTHSFPPPSLRLVCRPSMEVNLCRHHSMFGLSYSRFPVLFFIACTFTELSTVSFSFFKIHSSSQLPSDRLQYAGSCAGYTNILADKDTCLLS